MRRRLAAARCWLALVSAGLAHPATAQLVTPDKPAAQSAIEQADAATRTIDAEMQGYGAWTMGLLAVSQPAVESFRALANGLPALRTAPAATAAQTLRAEVVVVRAKIAAAKAGLNALDTPRFEALDLDADISPEQLVRDTDDMLTRMDDLAASIEPLFVAMGKGDQQAIEAAGKRLIGSVKLLVDSQLLLATASMATLPPESSDYQIARFERLLAQAGSRLIEARERMVPGKSDPTLAADIARIAQEVSDTAKLGTERLEAEISEQRAYVDEAGGAESRRVQSRALAVMESCREIFAVVERFGIDLGQSAETLRLARTGTNVSAAMRLLPPVRAKIDRLAARQAEIMAQ